MSKKTVLITGASSGIGWVSAERLAADGHHVFGTSRSSGANGPSGVTMLALDVRSEDSAAAAIAEVARQAGRIDVLVNNAGQVQGGCVEEVTIDQYRAVFETNFLGAVRMIQSVLPIMRRQNSGQILNMGSIAGRIASPYVSAYAATKHALEALTESLRTEVARFGISVSILEPAFYRTSATTNAQGPGRRVEAYDGLRDRAAAAFGKQMMNAPEPGEVADVVARLVEAGQGPRCVPVGSEAPMWIETRAKLAEPEWEAMVTQYWDIV